MKRTQEMSAPTLPRVLTLQHPRLALIALSLGMFMVLLDSTILNVALPTIEHELHGSLESLQWIANSYTLIYASLLLTGGALGDRYGVRTIFCLGLAIFTLASVLCSLAPSLAFLITARVIQGAGAALLLPTSLSLIPHLFTEARERTNAVAVWSGIAALAVASGPLLGGLLVDTFGWRSVFLVNLPCGLVALALTLTFIPTIRPQESRALDLPGQIFAIVACAALTYGLIEWGRVALPLTISAFIVSILAVGVFLAIEARSAHPMLPLQLFRSWTVSATLLVALIFQFSIYGMLFVFALFFQQAYHYTAFQAGIAFLPQTAVAAFILVFLAKWLLRWLRPGVMLAIGMLCGVVGLLVVLLGIRTTLLFVVSGQVLVGCYAGLVASPLAAVVLNSIPKELAGIASASLNVARQVGGVLGIALLGSALGDHSLVGGIQVALIIMIASCLIGLFLGVSTIRQRA
jgi:DHA2 family methylenomycin A resistance protein-like MFS transporter